MLFSNKNIATSINDNFEPVWQSVRPVPRVTIDFGNGKVIKRTLHGNVATMICEPNGDIVDILPGVYDAPTYLKRILELKTVREVCKTDITTSLRRYHTNAWNKAVPVDRNLPVATGRINRVRVAASTSLLKDTANNEGPRRKKIHAYLKTRDHVKPQDITKWLYREVLHADLDDPYMGLGETLFGNYPFSKEDEVATR